MAEPKPIFDFADENPKEIGQKSGGAPEGKEAREEGEKQYQKAIDYLGEVEERFINAGSYREPIGEEKAYRASGFFEAFAESTRKQIRHIEDTNADYVLLGRNFDLKKELCLGRSEAGIVELFQKDFDPTKI